MSENEIRLLKASEIECRIGIAKENGLSLLLYKDARVDQKILDETFGLCGWQRKHDVLNGRVYCTVSIWDREKGQWIEKQDVGTSGEREKEKEEASDSFKRACFSVGIGRKLYSSPFIWIPATKCNIEKYGDKYTCRENFRVNGITYGNDREIIGLSIANSKGSIVYAWALPDSQVRQELNTSGQSIEKKATEPQLSWKQREAFNDELKRTGVLLEEVLERYRLSSFEDMTPDIYRKAMNSLKRTRSEAA